MVPVYTVGEKVWAYNSQTGTMELEPVLHVWLNHDHDLVDLTLTTTTHAPHSTTVIKTSEVIHTNQKHPFFTLEHGFMPVGQLKLGMHVLRADGRLGVVTGWKIVPGSKVMYNLTVQQDHTFVVGVGQWVVHNTAGGTCGGELESGTPGDYLGKNAPMQTTPGTKTLDGQHVNDLGESEPWKAHYDEYGRQVGRTDYTRGDQSQDIAPTHYHVYSYNEGTYGYNESGFTGVSEFGDHWPGEYNPAEWPSGWEYLL